MVSICSVQTTPKKPVGNSTKEERTMLPNYEPPRLTIHRLTDDIMNAALEQSELLNMKVQTAREACYMYMSHAAIWDEVFDQFQKEAAKDLEEGFSALDVVAALSDAVDNALMWEDIRKYRQELKVESIATAMNTCHVDAQPDTMSFLLAAYVVGGHTALAEYDDILKEEGISEEDVIAVKKEMEEN